jgi:CTD small phosphatase-like protein 2
LKEFVQLPWTILAEACCKVWYSSSCIQAICGQEFFLIEGCRQEKKGPARNATVEHVNTKTSRHPRRSTSSAVPDKKVNDLITSSSKKQKPGKVSLPLQLLCVMV